MEMVMNIDEQATSIKYEDAISELDTIVRDMQSGKLSLEDSIAKYKRGMELAEICKSKLNDAQKQIGVMQEDGSIQPLEQNKKTNDSSFEDIPF
ncbi:exodeoxyribonuclease VII small subunit [Taylorella equigenitalis]|nr:exodeoxyribonuclease VII small subunit [Taylorella equigenitalis]